MGIRQALEYKPEKSLNKKIWAICKHKQIYDCWDILVLRYIEVLEPSDGCKVLMGMSPTRQFDVSLLSVSKLSRVC